MLMRLYDKYNCPAPGLVGIAAGQEGGDPVAGFHEAVGLFVDLRRSVQDLHELGRLPLRRALAADTGQEGLTAGLGWVSLIVGVAVILVPIFTKKTPGAEKRAAAKVGG